MIIATKGSKFDKIEAFEASTYRIYLFQIRFANPCTTIAVPINNIQSESEVLILIGESSINTNGIDTIRPTIFEYNVMARGDILLDSCLVIIIMIANVSIVTTIHIRPLST